MKIFGIVIENKKKRKVLTPQRDAYQDSLNRLGQEQFRKLLEKGIGIQLGVAH